MPIYGYKCEHGHTFELRQSFTDAPLTACQVCGAPVHKILYPVSVHFKGSGFYNTDYGTRRRAREAKEHKERLAAEKRSKSDSSTPAESGTATKSTAGATTSASSAGSGSSSDSSSAASESTHTEKAA